MEVSGTINTLILSLSKGEGSSLPGSFPSWFDKLTMKEIGADRLEPTGDNRRRRRLPDR